MIIFNNVGMDPSISEFAIFRRDKTHVTQLHMTVERLNVGSVPSVNLAPFLTGL